MARTAIELLTSARLAPPVPAAKRPYQIIHPINDGQEISVWAGAQPPW
jgi:hypothetical protein